MTMSLTPQSIHLFILVVWLVCTPFAKASDQMAEERRVAYSALQHQNYRLAYILFNKLAKQGDVYANYNLANLLESGHGTHIDVKRAITHYQFAFENGVLAAANNLGVIYAEGVDGTVSAELAVYYYKLAADQGNVRAQANLAQLYLLGKIVSQNISLAHDYFTRAALQNDVHSQFQLGVMYFKGDGVEQNMIEAYAWISLAKFNGDLQAQAVLDQLKPMLGRVALIQAEERVLKIRQMMKQTFR